jgi:hypothetical protein
MRSGDIVLTTDRGVFSYHGTDNAGTERWHADFKEGISVEAHGAPFRSGEPTTVIRRRDGDDHEFTVAKGDDGLVLVPGVEQPAIENATEPGVSGPAAATETGERTYSPHTQAPSTRRQSPSSGR